MYARVVEKQGTSGAVNFKLDPPLKRMWDAVSDDLCNGWPKWAVASAAIIAFANLKPDQRVKYMRDLVTARNEGKLDEQLSPTRDAIAREVDQRGRAGGTEYLRAAKPERDEE